MPNLAQSKPALLSSAEGGKREGIMQSQPSQPFLEDGIVKPPCAPLSPSPKQKKQQQLRSVLFGVALGQLLSLLGTVTAVASSVLAQQGIHAPTFQSLLNYLLLALVYGTVVVFRQRPLQKGWQSYCLVAFLDVEANYFLVSAFGYTSLTSVALLDCWAIPCAMVLTWHFLKTSYTWRHLIGVLISIAGIAVLLASDVHATDRARGSTPLVGDSLVLIGASLYAICNVLEEHLAHSVDAVEILALIGCFGSIISFGQLMVLEREEVAMVIWSRQSVLPFLAYAVALFLFYSLVPVLLKSNGSTMFNLSLLTSDVWAVAVTSLYFHKKVDWLYFVAFFAIVVGLFVYSWDSQAEKIDLRAMDPPLLDREGEVQHPLVAQESESKRPLVAQEQRPTNSFL